MAIAFDQTSTAVTSAANVTMSIGVNAPATGSVMVVAMGFSANQPTVTPQAGWTTFAEANVGGGHYALFWKARQSFDSTFGVNWTNSCDASMVMSSYSGVSKIQPIELATTNTFTSGTSLTTGAITPNGPFRWALGAFTSVAATTFTFTSTGNRVNAVSTTVTPFAGAQISDSNAVVPVSPQSFSSTVSVATTAGSATVFFLVPDNMPPDVFRMQAVNRAGTY